MCFPEKSDRLQLLQDLHYNYISCHNRHGRELPIDELNTTHTALFVDEDLKKQLTLIQSPFLYNETMLPDLCVVVFYVCSCLGKDVSTNAVTHIFIFSTF